MKKIITIISLVLLVLIICNIITYRNDDNQIVTIKCSESEDDIFIYQYNIKNFDNIQANAEIYTENCDKFADLGTYQINTDTLNDNYKFNPFNIINRNHVGDILIAFSENGFSFYVGTDYNQNRIGAFEFIDKKDIEGFKFNSDIKKISNSQYMLLYGKEDEYFIKFYINVY